MKSVLMFLTFTLTVAIVYAYLKLGLTGRGWSAMELMRDVRWCLERDVIDPICRLAGWAWHGEGKGMIIEGTIEKSGKNGPPLRIITWPKWDLQHPGVVEIERPIWVLKPKGEKNMPFLVNVPHDIPALIENMKSALEDLNESNGKRINVIRKRNEEPRGDTGKWGAEITLETEKYLAAVKAKKIYNSLTPAQKAVWLCASWLCRVRIKHVIALLALPIIARIAWILWR